MCRRYSSIETETDTLKLMKGGMNSHDVDCVPSLYNYCTHHQLHLQHIVLHAACLLASCRNLKQASQKMCHSILCEDIMPLLARSIIV